MKQSLPALPLEKEQLMKSIFRRAIAMTLCAALLSTTALASDALGSRIYSYTLPICDETTLTRQVMWSASRQDLRTENYVTYTPSASVSPMVSFGSSVLDRQTVFSMAKDLESDGHRVLGGVNGDYFVLATGDPLGMVVTDGILRSSASYHSAVGFRADGTAVIGKPELNLRANFGGYSLIVSDINKIRGSGNYYLFTDDFGPTTKNTKAGVDVILAPSGQLKIGSTVSCRVEQVIEATGATTIPAGKFVLSISNTANEWLRDTLRALQPGDPVDLEISSADTRWNSVNCAVGAMYQLLSGGSVVSGLDASSAAPRTAVGARADGSVIFYTIDGRQSGHSVGATIQMVAQRLKELGCVDAVLLDGGGSTTLVSTYPDYSTSTTINKPSDGALRSVSNAVFLVSNLSPTGQAGSLYVTPSSLTLLPGATTQCEAVAMDTGWYPMDSLPGPVTWTSPEGAVNESGLFTAPAATGVYTVTAESGGVTGSTHIQVYDTPDSIYVTNKASGKNVSTLTLTPGQQVDLNASASYRTIGLTGGDRCFSWTADSSIGTISPDGVFTAGPNTASGKIKVAAGTYAVTISVSVNAPAQFTLLADFEGDPYFTSAQADLTLNDSSAQVKCGYLSLQADYTLNMLEHSAHLTADRSLKQTDRYLSLWVYGDNSGNTLAARFTDRVDAPITQPLTTLNFSGWKQVSGAIPAEALAFEGLTITGSRTTGTLWLDQLTFSNQSSPDTQAPSVSLTVSGTTATARLSDNTGGSLARDRITLTVDGQAVPFSFEPAAGTLTATLTDLGTSLHRVTVTASDACGNLGRDSVTLSGSSSNPFRDMTNHWAADYTARLHELGVITGITEGGQINFRPDRSITRGDFALMAARWLGLDLDAYQNISLPYADVSSIPSWDLDAIKALYDLGILQGSKGADGLLRANASASITRAEAMTILGRMQARGYSEASLSAFSDASAVPSWARAHVASLVGQEVVGGSNGQLRPSAPVTRAEVAKMLVALW